tara:strand:- start:5052 stop:5333 length:282 start_codon:yes stop_codon:yes gene_type:complete
MTIKLNKMFDHRTMGDVRLGRYTDVAGRSTLWRGQLSDDGVAIKATLHSNQRIEDRPVVAIYDRTKRRVRSSKKLREIYDVMMSEKEESKWQK